MLFRPRMEDYKVIGRYSGKAIIGLGLTMLAPLFIALIFKEWDPAFDLLIGMFFCFMVGIILQRICAARKKLGWGEGLRVVIFSWFLATLLGSIPHYLSGHFGSYLDACFDVMSGYTTTGLYLIQDLDHISYALNTWRHLLSFIGGQGIIVIALTFISGKVGGISAMYEGEGKEERLLPNIIETARAIWLISFVYLALGTAVLWVISAWEGIHLVRGLLHAFWITMSAWSTGGFAPQSYNIGYYHSLPFELVTIAIFIIGSFNFALHWAVWTGNRREIYKNIETVSFFITLTGLFVLAVVGLARLGVYPDLMAFFRKAFYHVLSAHTTTGFMTIYSRQFIREWGEFSLLAVIAAMVIGGSACSTAGGIKGIRVGIIFKALLQDIRRMILPRGAIVVQRFHHIKDIILEEKHVQMAALITLSFVASHIISTLTGLYYGYPIVDTLFDSISAGTNTGLSCGVVSPSMPPLMTTVLILVMWAGRLEFIALFALIGFVAAIIKGK